MEISVLDFNFKNIQFLRNTTIFTLIRHNIDTVFKLIDHYNNGSLMECNFLNAIQKKEIKKFIVLFDEKFSNFSESLEFKYLSIYGFIKILDDYNCKNLKDLSNEDVKKIINKFKEVYEKGILEIEDVNIEYDVNYRKNLNKEDKNKFIVVENKLKNKLIKNLNSLLERNKDSVLVKYLKKEKFFDETRLNFNLLALLYLYKKINKYNFKIYTLNDLMLLEDINNIEFLVNNFYSLHFLLECLDNGLEKCFFKLCENSKIDISILKLRSRGYTLDSIGLDRGLTRERIRQIENKSIRKLTYFFDEFISFYIKNYKLLQLENLNNEFSEDFIDILIFISKHSDNYEYLEFINSICRKGDFNHKKLLELSNEILEDGIDIYENLLYIDMILRDNKFIIDFDNYIDFLKFYGFPHYGYFFTAKKKSIGGKFLNFVVKNDFPNGIKYNQNSNCKEEDLEKLRKICREKYGYFKLSDNDRSLSAMLDRTLVPCDSGMGISADKLVISRDILNEIIEYIDGLDENKILISKIYKSFESELLEKTNVNNKYFLRGVIKYYFSDKYTYKRDYIIKDKNSKIYEDMFTIYDKIESYIFEKRKPISINELQKVFYCEKNMIINSIYYNKNLIFWGGKYMNTLRLLTFSDAEIQRLKEEIIKILKESNNYSTIKKIYYTIYNDFKEMFIRNNINDEIKLFYVVEGFFRDYFDFNRPGIAIKGKYNNLSYYNVFVEILENKNYFYYKEFEDFCKDNLINESVKYYILHDVLEDYSRVSSEKYVLKQNLQISQNTVDEIDSIIEKNYHSYFNLMDMDFGILTQIEYDWNEYFFNTYIELFSKKYKTINKFIRNKDFFNIYVKKDSKFNNFTDIVLYELKDKHKETITELELSKLLIDKKLILKTIPKEFYNSEKVVFKDGIFTIK